MTPNGQEYSCYSKKIYGYLTMNGFRYIRTFKHSKTGRTCWVYTMTDSLSDALRKWTENNPNKKTH